MNLTKKELKIIAESLDTHLYDIGNRLEDLLYERDQYIDGSVMNEEIKYLKKQFKKVSKVFMMIIKSNGFKVSFETYDLLDKFGAL